MLDLAIVGGDVVIPETGVRALDIGISGERISMLAAPGMLPRARRTIQARGLHVLPGVIDPHIHLGAYGALDRDIEYETRAGLAGGVTTVGWFLRSPASFHEALPKARAVADTKMSTDYFVHPILSTEQHLEELPSYAERLGVTSFKVYMAGLPGIFSASDDDYVLRILARAAQTGPEIVIAVHAENEVLVERATERAKANGELKDLASWSRARPAFAQAEAIRRLAQFAAEAGALVYCVHLNSAAEVDAIRAARRDGFRLLAEAGTHYLSLTVDHPLGPLVKRSPPLRESADVEALWKAIADGTIDTIGTDMVVGSRAGNRAESGITDAKVGFTILGTHLPVILHEGSHRRSIDIRRLAEVTSLAPARVFGLYPRKGSILAGGDADLVITDLSRDQVVDHAALHTWSDFSPWDGQSLRGVPLITIRRGVVVAEGGKVDAAPGTGKFLERGIN